MARLLSVNVGLPRDIAWKGRMVHTGIWKYPVAGRCRAGRLNLDGDGQGDLAGHGGEQRAVLAYQIEAYRHWEAALGRKDFVYGQFGENFTIEGLADATVRIGDRYRIGTAVFEVTQPRVTCYRVGIRTNEPRMPALLTSSGLPGFYLRVLREGDVGAGDEITKIGEAPDALTVADINALLYSSSHPREQLERALRIQALSPGWRWSFEALLKQPADAAAGGNAGLAPSAARHAAAPGFRRLTVAALQEESADVLSLTLQAADGQPLPAALPGQYVVLRLQPTPDGPPMFRSYSLSGVGTGGGAGAGAGAGVGAEPGSAGGTGASSVGSYRISVKIEPNGKAGNYLRDHVRVGDVLDVSAPRGSFTLLPGDAPVVLLSAGIGATPVLAMLRALSDSHATRPIVWLHAARDGQHHPFAAEARGLVRSLAHGSGHVCYSRPGPLDQEGRDFDTLGHLSTRTLAALDVLAAADVYLCGPPAFMTDMKAALASLHVTPEHIHAEIFNGGESLTPGIAAAAARGPHPPQDETGTGPLISFARSGIAAHWNPSAYQSILEVAEACDVPVRWSCRAGVCHNCESGLVSGTVTYHPDPLDPPAAGNALICCARPQGDVVVDI